MKDRRLGIWLLVGIALAALAILVSQSSQPGTEAPPAAHGDGTGEADEVQGAALRHETPAGERTQVDAAPIDAATLEVRAIDPERLPGRVVTRADGTPVAGAEVQLRYRDADEFWNLDLEYGDRIDIVATTRTDADGRFAFDVTRGKPYRLHVFAAGYAATTVLSCTGGSEVVVRVGVGATVAGVVKRAGTGDGVGGVLVRIFIRGARVDLGAGETAPDGSFRFANLPAAMVYVEARPEELACPRWKELELEEDRSYQVDFALEAGRTIHGVVTAAATGAPIAGAELSDSWVFRRVVRTASDGSYEMRGLDERAELHVRVEGYAPQSTAVDVGVARQDFALVRGGRVVGRFLDERGAACAEVYAAAGAWHFAQPGVVDTDWRRVIVAPDGTFSGSGLDPSRRYQLYVRGDGIGARVFVLPRAIPDGGTSDVGTIVLRPDGGLEGRVVDDDGVPVASATVWIHGHNDDVRALLTEPEQAEDESNLGIVTQFRSRRGQTGSDGAFRFRGLSAGEYELSVRNEDRSEPIRSGPWKVSDGAVTGDVEVVLAKGLSITGQVRFAGGGASVGVEDLRLAAVKGGSGPQWARVDANGVFRIRGIEDGVYRLAALQCPKGWVLEPVEGVRAGADDVELVLRPAVPIRGRVVNARGEPVDANVFVWSTGVSFSATYHTDADGRFEVAVHPGFVGEISAQPANGMPFPQARAKNVVAGTTDLVLTLEMPTRVR